jgi:hypothetical protein
MNDSRRFQLPDEVARQTAVWLIDAHSGELRWGLLLLMLAAANIVVSMVAWFFVGLFIR